MNLHNRIARLEEQPVSDAMIRATVERLAREHDLDVDELEAEMRLILGMSDAERERYTAELREGVL